ncbi:fused MFS/spermidine synthase [Rugosimonospora acidiphila]|uniref:Fused MFS/spermidine synthase n=1 Tax=Rugosimonospora acidiphila TaxID=556531 RepID=A0ABP9RVX5_9ACTN
MDLGTAEFVPDPRRPRAWTLLIDGVAQSYVDLDRPTHLEFEYARRVAAVVDVVTRRAEAIRALHLGGGGLTLPRYVAATRPGSAQRVVERDATLSEAVGRILPLPGDARIEVLIGDAREEATRPDPVGEDRGRFDLVVADVYQAAQMPAQVATVEFAEGVRGLLADTGLYVLNVTDLPGLTLSRVQAATLRGVFADVAVIGQPGMLRGRRFGNVVLAASPRPGGLPVSRLTAALRDAEGGGARLVHAAELDDFVAGARPFTDSAAGVRLRPTWRD